MKYSKDIVQGLASYIDLKDVKSFIENKNKLFDIGSFIINVIIVPATNIEYIIH